MGDPFIVGVKILPFNKARLLLGEERCNPLINFQGKYKGQIYKGGGRRLGHSLMAFLWPVRTKKGYIVELSFEQKMQFWRKRNV